MKALFTPFSVLAGILAGQISKRLFVALWGVIDDEEAPQGKHRYVSLGQLALALAVQGAIQKLVKGLVDHGARHGFAQFTGEWPGPERPEDEDDD